MHSEVARLWVRWFSSVGLPTEHMARVLGLELLEVELHLRAPRLKNTPIRHPSWFDCTGPVRNRSIRCQTAQYVRRLHELGYQVDRIAELLELRRRPVADFLERTTPTPSGPRVKPRTKREQCRVEATGRRREQRQAIAARIVADRAAWDHHAARRDDVDCEAAPPPAGAELVDQVEAPAACPAPSQWHVDPGPRGFWEIPNDANPIVEPPPELPAAARRSKTRRWKPSADEPRWGARGSAARFDDEGCVPLPRCPARPPADELVGRVAAPEAPLPPVNRWRGGHCNPSTDTKAERGLVKLSWDKVREMRRLALAGAMTVDIAMQFGISQKTTGLVLANRKWFDPDYSPELYPLPCPVRESPPVSDVDP